MSDRWQADASGASSHKTKESSEPGLLKGWGDEIEPLSVLIWLRLLGKDADAGINPRDPGQAASVRAQVTPAQREFVELRFARRIAWYVSAVNKLNIARNAVSGALVAGGLLISGITASHATTGKGLSVGSYVVVALGVMVGVLGAIGPRVARAQQIERYRRGMNRLRREGWQFVNRRGPYADLDDVQQAFATFVDHVDAVETDAIATELDVSSET